VSLMPRSTGSVVISVRTQCDQACDVRPLQWGRLHADALRRRQTWQRNSCLHVYWSSGMGPCKSRRVPLVLSCKACSGDRLMLSGLTRAKTLERRAEFKAQHGLSKRREHIDLHISHASALRFPLSSPLRLLSMAA